MQPLKETKRARAIRMAESEGGRRFRSKTWSKRGKDKCPKKARKKAKQNLKDC